MYFCSLCKRTMKPSPLPPKPSATYAGPRVRCEWNQKDGPGSWLGFTPGQRQRKTYKMYSVEKDASEPWISTGGDHETVTPLPRTSEKEGEGRAWNWRDSAVETLLTFKLRYPLRLLQYQQLRSSRIPRITVRMPIPAALAQETDTSTLVWEPCSNSLHRGFAIRAAPPSPQGVFHPTPPRAPMGLQHAYTETEPSLGASQVCVHSSNANCCGPQNPGSKSNRCSGSWPFCGLSYLSIRASLKHFPQLSVHKKETEINFNLMSAVSWVPW